MTQPWSNTSQFALVIISAGGGFQGLFVYSPAPGPGNLIASIAASAGTDPYGNPYQAGITSYDTTFGGLVQLANGAVNVFLAAGLEAVISGFGYFLYSPVGGLGNLVFSSTQATGTDQYGNVFKKGITSYNTGTGNIVRLDTGAVFFTSTGSVTDGQVGDFGGTLNLRSIKATAADVACSMTLQSKINSFDGASPEIVAFNRIQLQNGIGNPGFVVNMDPNNPTADESFHHFAFAGAGATLWSAAPTGINPGYRLLADLGKMELAGRFVIPTGGPVGGQAMTIGLNAPYRPANVQSVAATVITGANPNSFVRCFYSTGGVLALGGPVAALAAGDVIEVMAADIDLIAA